ncbi:MAG: sugar phosphate isomerase/epimerase family protein [Sphingobacteriales bacterium]
MGHSSRRDFLQTSALLLAATMVNSSFDLKKKSPLLSFSTLGCPDWTFKQIADFAQQHYYDGIELRGLRRELDLNKCPEFSSAQNRMATLKMMEEKGLRFVDLGSSATLHFANPTERKKNLEEGKRFIDLAQDLKCPFIRVFPNSFPKEQEKNKTMELIISGLLELADYAKGSTVTVLIESHGDLVVTEDLEVIMRGAEHDHAGMIWDVANMWTITKENPVSVYEKLKKYIRHTHIKDAAVADGKVQYALLGKGEVPIFDAIDALSKGGYKGYYSFEWEKLWHPELAEPEIALADYPVAMKNHFKKM